MLTSRQIQKLRVIVELLIGEIPEREMFRRAIFRKALLPYMHLTQGLTPS
jgi:26S proteasome regulatory subunit N3